MTVRPPVRRWAGGRLAALVLLGGVLAAGLLWAPAASAHAVLVSSSPVDGTRVNSEPAQVRLTFDESVGLIPAAEEVISSTGLRADTGQPRLVAGGTTIVLALRPHLPDGTYSATWRVVSADTHVVSGSVTFGLGVNPGAGVAGPADHTGELDVAADVAQGLVYAGIVALVGVLAAARMMWPWSRGRRRVRVLAWAGWAALLCGTAAAFLLQGPRAANGSWPAVARLQDADVTLDSAFGAELLARAALLVAVVPLLTRRSRQALPGRGGDLTRCAASLALLAAVAVAGHASVGAGAWLAIPAAMLHMAAMAVWLGGLVLLGLVVLPALQNGSLTLAEARLRLWSATAYTCVVCLVVSGEYQAARQISPIQALWTTSYGITVLIKGGLVIAMLAAAALAHRLVIRPDARETTPPGVARAVRRSVRIEASLGAVVLAVTAVLVSEAPARTTFGPPVTVTAPLGNDRVSVHLSTTRRGPQAITIRLLDPAGAAVPAQSVTATLSSPDVAALNVTLHKTAVDGSSWASVAAVAPLPGTWTLTINVALTASTAYATSAAYQVW
ncbi:MAG TPA: copper resistance protein CopC [Streptosporangiaceae bacterium]|nr:copper resistance protein CopC [Streptosporangiaceae bacterium]